MKNSDYEKLVNAVFSIGRIDDYTSREKIATSVKNLDMPLHIIATALWCCQTCGEDVFGQARRNLERQKRFKRIKKPKDCPKPPEGYRPFLYYPVPGEVGMECMIFYQGEWQKGVLYNMQVRDVIVAVKKSRHAALMGKVRGDKKGDVSPEVRKILMEISPYSRAGFSLLQAADVFCALKGCEKLE